MHFTYVPSPVKKELLNQLIEHPVVTVLGLRLAGKTTLVKHTLADYQYVNLKFQIFGNFPIDDPGALLRLYSGKVIFDEIQNC